MIDKVSDSVIKLVTLGVAFLIAVVYSLKLYDELYNEKCEHEDKPKNKGRIIRQLLYGAFGSGLVCILICEALTYFNLPFTLSLVIGAWCGYMGADIVKDTLLRFIDKKLEKQGGAQ